MTHGLHAMTPLDGGALGIGYIVGILLLLYVVLRTIAGLRKWWRHNAALYSVAVESAAEFWANALRTSDGRPTAEQRACFRSWLRSMLMDHYADRGFFPVIGIAYHRPHEYGVDDLMYSALRLSGIVSGINRDMDHLWFSKVGRMEITLGAVRFQDGGVGEFSAIA